MSQESPLEELEETEIDVGTVKCACKCGLDANQLHRGIPISNRDPMLHYRRYQQRIRGQVDERRYRLRL